MIIFKNTNLQSKMLAIRSTFFLLHVFSYILMFSLTAHTYITD